MVILRRLLQDRSWRMLRAIARAHQTHFDSRWTKRQAVERLLSLLTDPPKVRRALSDLPDDAHEALQTLLACDGEMPAHRFLEHFGPVRPYRPWRDGSPRAPWRNPVSPAERLWFLGLIFFHSNTEQTVVIIPQDLRPLLPTPSAPTAEQPHHDAVETVDPILDLAHLLAFLQGHEVTPFAERWLTPRPLRALNAALAYPDPAVPQARSELQTGYVRFLHYLAETSGLVAVVGGLLKPTPAAWQWLDAPEAQRWRVLWDGWLADLVLPHREDALWSRYRLPGRSAFVASVFDTLASFEADPSPMGARIDFATLVKHLRRRSIGAGTLPPGEDVLMPLRALLAGPLFWAGWVRTDSTDPGDAVSLTPWGAWLLDFSAEPPEPPPTQPAVLRSVDDGLVIALPEPPARPTLRPLVELGLPARDRSTRDLTRQRFVSFLSHGLSCAWVIEMLRELTADRLPSTALERLATWEEQARGLRLRRLTVLSVVETDLLHQLTGQRTIRRHLRETLSPHHVAVDPNEVEPLLRALRRRGHIPLAESGLAAPKRTDRVPEDAGAAAHLWLALRTYLDLADLVRLPAAPPVALLDQLASILDEESLAEVTALADDARRRVRDTIDGYTPFPASLTDVDHDAIRDLVERAVADDDAIEIVYHTAGRGERTTRVVEPLRLEDRGGVLYLIGHCRLRQDERVFRLDRVERAELVADG